jgi:hypothetical protein
MHILFKALQDENEDLKHQVQELSGYEKELKNQPNDDDLDRYAQNSLSLSFIMSLLLNVEYV